MSRHADFSPGFLSARVRTGRDRLARPGSGLPTISGTRAVQATDGDGNPLFETDEDGNLILDGDGNPIPVMVTINVNPSLSVFGVANSPRFFTLFNTGGTHAGRLTSAELRLVSEWVDIGAQYFNNPFDAP